MVGHRASGPACAGPPALRAATATHAPRLGGPQSMRPSVRTQTASTDNAFSAVARTTLASIHRATLRSIKITLGPTHRPAALGSHRHAATRQRGNDRSRRLQGQQCFARSPHLRLAPSPPRCRRWASPRRAWLNLFASDPPDRAPHCGAADLRGGHRQAQGRRAWNGNARAGPPIERRLACRSSGCRAGLPFHRLPPPMPVAAARPA